MAQNFVRTNGQKTIELKMTWEPNGFGHGERESMSCALARPYKQLFEEGKPIGRISHIFFQVNKLPSYILGSICFTPRQRLLFFPGLIERKINWFHSENALKNFDSSGLLDHFTLEKNFQKWHLTILESNGTKKEHIRPFSTKEVQKNTFFWFGLTIQDPSHLETTPKELTLTFPSPPKDSARRIELLMKARENAILHLTRLNKMPLNEGEFLHFDFFIGRKDLVLESLPCFVPTQEPIVSGYAQAFEEGTHFRFHLVSLEGVTENIWVIVSKHVGKVSDKAIISMS